MNRRINHNVDRVLDLTDVEHFLFRRWSGFAPRHNEG